ncbi:MAG: hypothetical protein COB39_11765 [Marinosulfonomonas sp.]|nr:MAG: hypothetical protein COB39_11765 [Marinosulfonomonas sp.]
MGMIWLAKNDVPLSMLCAPSHIPSTAMALQPDPGSEFLERGSIIVETTVDRTNPSAIQLLQCSISGEIMCDFSLSIDGHGAVKAEVRYGKLGSALTVAGNTSETHTQLRITLTWDMQDKSALLSVESPEHGTLNQTEINTPLSIPLKIIDALLQQNSPAHTDSSITFLGISDQIEPVGFTPSIAGHSPIDTPNGLVPIEALKCGDLVTTVDNGPQPIRWICERCVPTRGLFQPLRLRAPYFGLTRDILVAPEQRLVFENTEIEYLFGVESVLVEARHLTNKVNVILEPAKADSIRLYQLLFDHHEIITVAGCRMESLFVGQIANNPDMLKSTLLGGLPAADVPHHKEMARPLLRPYEAMTLKPAAFH